MSPKQRGRDRRRHEGRGRKLAKSEPPPATWQELEAALDRLHQDVGFSVLRFSQRRRSRQTEGIPDRLYAHELLRVAFWFEAKFGRGAVEEDQENVHTLLRLCGHRVVVGGLEEARENLLDLGIVAAEGGRAAAGELCSRNAPAMAGEKPDQVSRQPQKMRRLKDLGLEDLARSPVGKMVPGPNGGWLQKGADGVFRQVRRRAPGDEGQPDRLSPAS